MKKAIIAFALLLCIPFSSFTQDIENVDYISSVNEGLIAIKKEGQWAFINNQGSIVVDFRADLVLTQSEDGNYPIFVNGRCLIVNKEKGISYFGYIDTTGNIVIAPQFLNANNFRKNSAVVLKVIKEKVGKNEVLDKNMVYYRYFEVIIDLNGVITDYLDKKGINIVLDKQYLRKPPIFKSKRIADNLVGVKGSNGKWLIKKIN